MNSINTSGGNISWNDFVNEMLAKGEVSRVQVVPESDIVEIYLHPGAVIFGRPVRCAERDENKISLRTFKADVRAYLSFSGFSGFSLCRGWRSCTECRLPTLTSLRRNWELLKKSLILTPRTGYQCPTNALVSLESKKVFLTILTSLLLSGKFFLCGCELVFQTKSNFFPVWLLHSAVYALGMAAIGVGILWYIFRLAGMGGKEGGFSAFVSLPS